LPILSVVSVIDDDASVRAAIENLLSSHGYVVHPFASAEEFLHWPRLDESSCIVADVQMLATSGLDLLLHLRARGYVAPFIFITAVPEESVRARALKAGAISFLAKPFSGPTHIDCVETAVKEHRSGAANEP
jgi:FixJ family two-component response regulator